MYSLCGTKFKYLISNFLLLSCNLFSLYCRATQFVCSTPRSLTFFAFALLMHSCTGKIHNYIRKTFFFFHIMQTEMKELMMHCWYNESVDAIRV